MKSITRFAFVFAMVAALAGATAVDASDNSPHTSATFHGPKANTGNVIIRLKTGKAFYACPRISRYPTPRLRPGAWWIRRGISIRSMPSR